MDVDDGAGAGDGTGFVGNEVVGVTVPGVR